MPYWFLRITFEDLKWIIIFKLSKTDWYWIRIRQYLRRINIKIRINKLSINA